MAFKLAQLFVEFTTRGIEKFAPALGGIKKDLDGAKAGAEAFGKGLGDTADKGRGKLEQLKQAANTLGQAAQKAFTLATATLGGFITAGLAGTTQGQKLKETMGELATQVAGTFMPVIDSLTNGLRRVTEWFKGLSREQQESVQKWTLIGLGALGVVAILPKVVAGIGAIITVGKLGLAALTAMTAHPVVLGFTVMAAAMGGVIVALTTMRQKAEEARKELERFQSGQIQETEIEKSPTAQRIRASADPAKQAAKEEESASARIRQLEEKRAMDEAMETMLETVGSMGASGLGGTTTRMAINQVRPDPDAEIQKAKKELEVARQFRRNPNFQGTPDPARHEVNKIGKSPQFENVQDTWKRLAQISMGQKTPEKEHIEKLVSIFDVLKEISERLAAMNPAVA